MEGGGNGPARMTVPIVAIIEGSERAVGEGVNRPIRCLVRLPDNTLRAAVVKRINPEGVAAEVFCALLLRAWGLGVPEPAIVQADQIAFASIDSGFPNLKQRIGWQDHLPAPLKNALAMHGARIVAGFEDTPRALAVDEAIANRDRNLGNILWDGQNVAWIDHERALGLGSDPDENKLAAMVVAANVELDKIQMAAVSISMSLGAQAIADARSECTDLNVAGFAAQVSSRQILPCDP